MKNTKMNSLILCLLALVFIAPGLSAYLYYSHPQWLTAKPTNKGVLLSPPMLLTEGMTGGAKWRLILLENESCETDCMLLVDRLARIRLALGRHLYEVQQWLFVADKSPNLMTLSNKLQEEDIQLFRLSPKAVENLPAQISEYSVFIANPDGYLILAYPADVKSDDIYHDLKQLLKKSG